MKRVLSVLLTVALCLTLCFSIAASESVVVKMTIGQNVGYINGEAHTLDAAPIIRNDRTMLPVRFVAEAFGAAVAWDGSTATATLTRSDVEIMITIGAEFAVVDGEAVKLDSPAFIENDRTYMPVRFVAESLGATVEWDGTTSTATLTYAKEEFVPFPDDYTVTYPNGFDYVGTDLSQYVTLGAYKGLTAAEALPAEITDADVAARIEEVVAENPMRVEITDRAADMYDSVVIDYVGTVDGVAFDGGSDEGAETVLGMGMYVEGFEEGIIGMNVGETKKVEVTFPDDYYTELAGKKAEFTITLRSIYEETPAEYNDEFVKALGYESVAEFEASVKAELNAERDEEIHSLKATAAFNAAYAHATITKLPEGLVEDYMNQQIEATKELATVYGMTYETLIVYGNGITVAEYETAVRTLATETVKQELVIMAIAKAEGLIATTECDAMIAELCTLSGCDNIAELSIATGVSEASLYNSMLYVATRVKVESFLAENITITQQ